MKCKNCKHEILKQKDSKSGQINYVHFNSCYFGTKIKNSNYCSKCENEGNKINQICRKPEPKTK